MANVLIPLPSLDFDPSEVAVSWSVLTNEGHRVSFATPDGKAAQADPIMLSGRGLDPWSPIPILGNLRMCGTILRANKDARQAYAKMTSSVEYQKPLRWSDVSCDDFDAVLLGGGHRARGMRQYLESPLLQVLVSRFFELDKPVAAICHGVLLAARSRAADGKSVLHGRKTTSLTWKQEKTASALAHVGRPWDRNYYRTYTEQPHEPEGYMSVEHEVRRNLDSQQDFLDVPQDDKHLRRKTSGLARDTMSDDTPAWVVRDGKYVSARWPGDAHTFGKTFLRVLAEEKPSAVSTNY